MITMTPEMFGGRTYNGITVENVGDDCDRWMGLGHIDQAAFAGAALQDLRHLTEPSDPDAIDVEAFDPDCVDHRWAILTDLSGWPSPDDWAIRWTGVDEATPGAFPITILTID